MAWSAKARAASAAARRRKGRSKAKSSSGGITPDERKKLDAFIKKMGDKQRKETIKLSIRAKRKKYGPSKTGNQRIAQKMKQGGTYYVPGQGVKAFSARPRLKPKRKK